MFVLARILLTGLFFILVTLGVSGPTRADTTGNISGHVFTTEGQPLPGATVQLAFIQDFRDQDRNIDFRRRMIETRQTNVNGFYVFLSLEPGLYELRPVLTGWNFYCLPRIIVFAGQTSFVDLSMTPLELFVNCGEQRYFGPP